MKRKVNHIELQPALSPEILHVISGSRIAWNKSKEEIWPELLAKVEDKKGTTSNSKTVYLKVIRYAAAAVLALFIGISSAMYFYIKTIKTSQSQAVVFLPDNSRVTVYAQSNLTYKPWLWMFARTVKLEGESLFEVQKGKKFEVLSPKGKTMVLGTQFTVYARNNAYNVTCFSGKVKVVEMSKLNEAVITGGQKATLKPDGYFEVTDTKYLQPENNKVPQNQVIEEELKSVLSIPAEKVQASEAAKVSVEKQIIPQPETGKADKAAEPSAKPTQPEVVLPNKEQAQPSTQTQAQPKEQQLTGEDKATEQPAGKQQDKFRASLTPEQISILENQQMGKDEKRKAFMQSLSPEQRQLLDEQNRERARQNESAKPEPGKNEEIKEQQKMQTRQQMQNNTQNREQQKQQTQQGQEKPGASGAGNADKPESGKRN